VLASQTPAGAHAIGLIPGAADDESDRNRFELAARAKATHAPDFGAVRIDRGFRVGAYDQSTEHVTGEHHTPAAH
jgi:hypothetical protein